MNDESLTWVHEIRRRLESPEPRRLPVDDSRPAAVLVPLYVDAGELWTVLTKRSEELPTHAGQIAFPGGRIEKGETAWEAALREAQEEVGFDPGRTLQLGHLDEADTPSGFRIVPCVGAIPFPLDPSPNEEIAEVFAVPLLALADVRLTEDRVVEIDGHQRMIRVYHVGRRQVWGLTARIIQNLMERLGLAVTEAD